jgi:hypothetical protein
MDWLDDLYDEAGNLIKQASFDNVFGETPESGSLMDIGQSLLNPNYDPESSLFNRVTEGGPPPSMGDISAALKKDPNVDINTIPSTVPNPVDRSNEPEPTPFVPSEYTMNMPARMSGTNTYNVPTREVGMVGGKPNLYGRERMVLDDGSEEEERRRMIAALRNRYV